MVHGSEQWHMVIIDIMYMCKYLLLYIDNNILHLMIARNLLSLSIIFISILMLDIVDIWTQIRVWMPIKYLSILVLFKDKYLSNILHDIFGVSQDNHGIFGVN